MEPGYGEVRLSESVVVETVTAIGVQMTHQMVFQAGGDCGDGLDENDEQQAEEWLVHGVSLAMNVGRRCAFLLFLYQSTCGKLEHAWCTK